MTAVNHLGPLTRLARGPLVEALASAFPAAAKTEAGGSPRGPSEVDAAGAVDIRGGRSAAVERLAAIDPARYALSRNHVGGAVTGLSPWIRHGCLSLAEIRDAAIARVPRVELAEKLVSELAWRAYWRQVQAAIGDAIHDDLEPPAAHPRAAARSGELPDDVRLAATGMPCMDAFIRTLQERGLLHNHERMWLASWLVHVRGVRWQAGADWFLRHLLDGDPASNHLSWQWVAGTFAAKPYLFNRENLDRYTDGVHCRPCPRLGHCDVEGDYDSLAARLFAPRPAAEPRPAPRIRAAGPWTVAAGSAGRRPLVWLTLDAAAATSPAAATFPDAPRLFVVDDAWLAAERPSLKRLVFLFECLGDVPDVEVVSGDPRVEIPDAAVRHGCDSVAVAETPCPRTRRAAEAVAAGLPVVVVRWPAFCEPRPGADLGRFSRFWQQVRADALRGGG
jgi:deoxyribodipyrimidine photo-lyase